MVTTCVLSGRPTIYFCDVIMYIYSRPRMCWASSRALRDAVGEVRGSPPANCMVTHYDEYSQQLYVTPMLHSINIECLLLVKTFLPCSCLLKSRKMVHFVPMECFYTSKISIPHYPLGVGSKTADRSLSALQTPR